MVSVLRQPRKQADASAKILRPMFDALIEEGPLMSDSTLDFYRRGILDILTTPVRNGIRYLGATRQSANALVREADRYIIDAGIRSLHITELCEVFNVHSRRLFRAFHDVHGMGPIAFMRHKRLCNVHTVLRQGGHGMTVKQIAIRYGFLEPGRFSATYRQMFGELPSQTLRRTIHRATFALFLTLGTVGAMMNDDDDDDHFIPPRVLTLRHPVHYRTHN